MLRDHLQLISAIMHTIPVLAWPCAFSSILVREKQEKPLLYNYLQNILHSQIEKGIVSDFNYGLTEELLIPDADIPPNSKKFSGTSSYIPSNCHYNGVPPIFDQAKAFSILGLTGAEQEIATAVYAIDQYTAEMAFPLKCAVHPYTDCVLITALLFSLRKSIRDGKMLKFLPADWADLQDTLRGEDAYDITYMSSGLKDASNNQYVFKNIKSNVSMGRMLFNNHVYSNETSQRRQKQNAYTEPFHGINFNGDFKPKESMNFAYFEEGENKVPVQLQGYRSDFDYEAKMIIALANGELPYDAIVPSLQGFLWTVEAGFLQDTFGRIGSLITKEIPSSQGNVGFGIKIRTKEKESDCKRRADFLLTALLNLQSLVLRNLMDCNINSARQVMGVLKGPIVFTRGYDSGVLARIPADLAIKAAFPGKLLFEKESTYIPQWWKLLPEPTTFSENSSLTGCGFRTDNTIANDH